MFGGKQSLESSSMLLLSRFNHTRVAKLEKILGTSVIELSPKNAFVRVSLVRPQSPSNDVK